MRDTLPVLHKVNHSLWLEGHPLQKVRHGFKIITKISNNLKDYTLIISELLSFPPQPVDISVEFLTWVPLLSEQESPPPRPKGLDKHPRAYSCNGALVKRLGSLMEPQVGDSTWGRWGHFSVLLFSSSSSIRVGGAGGGAGARCCSALSTWEGAHAGAWVSTLGAAVWRN